MKKGKIVKILMIITLLISIQMPSIAATTGVIKAETVRVREDATTKSNIVELVSVGDKITVIAKKSGKDGIWYKVELNGKVGYIRNDLITVKDDVPYEDEPNEEEPNENDDPIITENPDETEEPDNNGEDNGETPDEQIPPENNLAVIQRNDKTISVLKSAGGVVAEQSMQLAETIKIKLLPSANSANIAELNANTQVTILEVINSWCRVESSEGACGWVRIDQ